jgi:XTP/dITP diphosphohydrolase
MFPKKVLIASSNPKKVKEIEEILSPLGIEVIVPPEKVKVEEYGTTFIGNAYLKAKAYYERFKIPTLADDSGLIVEAINPYPGVYSARFYALEKFGKEEPFPSEDEANIRKLLRVLKDKENRNAKFVSDIVLMLEEGKFLASEGEVEGKIIDTPRGNKGFGYDPIFVPQGYTKTFAEMESEEKHKISHRGKALRKLVELLKECYLKPNT